MTAQEVESRSSQIISRLVSLPDYIKCGCIMLYWSCHNEVQTHDLVQRSLNEGKRVILPRCDTEHEEIYPYEVRDVLRDLEVGPFGILQPHQGGAELADLSQIDVCILPGIAFDRKGNRVGRGLGYYDRFLRRLDEKTAKIGLAYAFQIVSKIYPTDGDASVGKIVTERETLVVRPSVIR